MDIVNSEIADIPYMLRLYDVARQYQIEKKMRHWQSFDPALLEKEISEKKQWKIIDEGKLACIFMIAYDDPYIWGEKNSDPSVYIHRIVTAPEFRGRNLTKMIVEWARDHGKQLGKKFLRMDTWGDNPKLIEYYCSCGFDLLETITPESTKNLPAHYSCISLSLLEMPI